MLHLHRRFPGGLGRAVFRFPPCPTHPAAAPSLCLERSALHPPFREFSGRRRPGPRALATGEGSGSAAHRPPPGLAHTTRGSLAVDHLDRRSRGRVNRGPGGDARIRMDLLPGSASAVPGLGALVAHVRSGRSGYSGTSNARSRTPSLVARGVHGGTGCAATSNAPMPKAGRTGAIWATWARPSCARSPRSISA